MARRPKSGIPRYKRRRQRSESAIGRFVRFLAKLVLVFLIGSVLWVLAYRFVNPPITATMLGDVLAGRGAERDWMPIERIDRDMVRAAIAGEDSKFCTHDGFDRQAILALPASQRGGAANLFLSIADPVADLGRHPSPRGRRFRARVERSEGIIYHDCA